jgi:hypothetical protein
MKDERPNAIQPFAFIIHPSSFIISPAPLFRDTAGVVSMGEWPRLR